jgi:hypothetical protein
MSGAERLGVAAKVRLASAVLWCYAVVQVGLRRRPLPQLVQRLGEPGKPRQTTLAPRRLGAIVHRVLRVWPLRARCLVAALVLYRLLERRGIEAELVLGLPAEAEDHSAHAWIEVDGVDVGPPPGKSGHRELARYGGNRGDN